MAGIGDNQPPDMTATAGEAAADVNEWLKENPVIEQEDQAREAKLRLDRLKLTVKDLEAERDQKVRPLNEQVKSINDYYRVPRDGLNSIISLLAGRITKYVVAETEKRENAAREAARRAAEAEQIARDAERQEIEALEAADQGELGVDIKDATERADAAFRDYKKTAHQAAIAERDTRVKVGGGLSRAIGLKTQEIWSVSDPMKAIKIIGMTSDIEQAIIKSAKAYKRLHDEVPAGIEIRTEKKV